MFALWGDFKIKSGFLASRGEAAFVFSDSVAASCSWAGLQVALSTVTVLKPCREDHVTADGFVFRCVRSSDDF